MSDAPAGWYPDATIPQTQRYWDGQAWTEHVAPIAGVPAAVTTRLALQPTTPDGAPLAGYWWRVLAYVIDGVVIGVPSFLISLPQQIELQRRMNELTTQLESSADPDFGAFWEGYFRLLGDQVASQLPVMLLGVLYVVVMLRWKGATLGKLAVGLRVRLRERPGRLPWTTIAARVLVLNVLGVVPFLLIAAGLWVVAVIVVVPIGVFGMLNLLWPAWDSKRQALHDKVARTNVVKVP